MELRPNKKRANYAMIMIGIVMFVEIISIISEQLQYNFLQEIANGQYVTEDEADSNDSRQAAVGVLYLIAFVISATTFIQWFRRAYYNLGQRRQDLSHTDGWTAGSWFIPFVSLYLPYQLMKEMYSKTHEYLLNNRNYSQHLSTSTLGWWWFLWVVTGFVGNISARLAFKSDSLSMLETSSIVSVISSVINLIAGVITLMVINNYREVEHLLQESEEDSAEND